MRQPTHYYPLTTQLSSYDSSVAVSNAFGAHVHVVRLIATTACHIVFAGTPTATTNDMYLAAGREEYFSVHPGQKVAAIKATGSSAGILNVTEMTQ
jgi:hypothetical protein